jgi:uncharacterized protein (DUF4415 family)
VATEVGHLNRFRVGKSRITIMADENVLESFRQKAKGQGIGYQTLINIALREHLGRRPVDEQTLRRILSEELHPSA